jgi:maltose/moltooligosaccharide transporter
MVVELCTSKNLGKFTGYYYTASMSAQTITPILLGFVFMKAGIWGALPIYSSCLIALSFLVFTLFVKNIKIDKVKNAKGLEALDSD